MGPWASCDAGPTPSYTPPRTTAGSVALFPRTGIPLVPSRPSASARSDSWTRSSDWSSPSKVKVHAVSASTSGTSRRTRLASWSARIPRTVGGPPPTARTPGGVPVGSRPTETTVAGAKSGTSRCESLPGSSPSEPNSSPAMRTRPAATPLRQSSEKSHCDPSTLSVRPISTCFASLVTRGSTSPASRAALVAISTASRSPSRPRPRNLVSTAARSSDIRAFGGSLHSGSGIRSIFRLFSRCDTRVASIPRRPSSATVAGLLRRAPHPPRPSPLFGRADAVPLHRLRTPRSCG
jgi:hypothetical protein